MINKYRFETNKLLYTLQETKRTQEARLQELSEYEGLSLKYCQPASGKRYYSVTRRQGKGDVRHYRYVGDDTKDTVRYVKELKHLKKALKALTKDIRLLSLVQSGLEDFEADAIDKVLPGTYRNATLIAPTPVDPRLALWKQKAEARKAADIAANGVFHPEELVHPTKDGAMVRSKGEALIYNRLLDLGVTFVYELPVRIGSRKRYPDFTLLSEVDFKTEILIEHQGMMNLPVYRERFRDRVYDYLCAGYISCDNIFYTFDAINGSTDTETIVDIVNLRIRPKRYTPD